MQITASRIKVTIPRRRTDILSRPRLNELVQELLDNKLILISAPAGYGKTSLLIEAAQQTDLPFCWYNLDNLDQDLHRFVSNFIASIDQKLIGFSSFCQESLQAAFQNNYAPEAMARLVAGLVFNHVGAHMAMVLDDYHLVDQSSAVNLFINRFVQEIDESFHLVILSRSLIPFIDLPLLVARSQVGGLGYQELSFQPEEIQSLLLQNYKQVIPESLAKELAEKTEGWITGLLLSAQTMWQGMADRKRISRVSGVNLDDYLIHQILEQQPADVRDFLLRTSIFDEFNAAWCADVLGPAPKGANWQSLITKALQYNLFVLPIDDGGTWLRFHQLFREFLQKQLIKQNPEEYKAILRSLANAYLRQRDWARAYDTLQTLGDIEALVKMLEQAGEPMVRANQLAKLAEWLDALPPGTLETRPMLLARRGIVAATLGETHWGLSMLNQAVEALRQNGDHTHLAGTLIWRALVNYIQTDHAASLCDTDEVLSITQNSANLSLYQAEAKRIRGLNHRLLGNRNEATQNFNEALELYRNHGEATNISRLLLDLGAVYIDIGNLSEGLRCFNAVLEHYREEKSSYLLVRRIE
jgi:LuxR family transcriptional regulator, maltose regulon positive regulatory protein